MNKPIIRVPSAIPILGLVAVLTVYGCAGADTSDTVLESSSVSVTRDGKVIGTKERSVREIEDGL